MRFIVMISYSLYLWHWPILVMQNSGLMVSQTPATRGTVKIAIFLLSLVAATLSWRFVEQPFRKGRLRLARRPLFLATAAVSCAIALVGVFVIHHDGLPQRFSPEFLRLARYQDITDPQDWRTHRCFIVPPDKFQESYHASECLDSAPEKKSYLLYGDSTAAELYPGLVAAFPAIHFQQATAAGCLPIPDASANLKAFGLFGENCLEMQELIEKFVQSSDRPYAVMFAARWDSNSLTGLGVSIAQLRNLGVRPIVIGPEVRFDLPLPLLLTQGLRGGKPSMALDLSSHLVTSRMEIDKQMADSAAGEWQVRYISRIKDICQGALTAPGHAVAGPCPLFSRAGEPLNFDDDHFSVSAAQEFLEQVRDKHQIE